MKRFVVAAALLLALLVPASSRAQGIPVAIVRTPDSSVTQLVLKDGSVLAGRVLEVTETTVRFSSAFGETTLQRSAVKSARILPMSALHDGVIWPEDPSRTRLLFAPTGRMLRPGETYFTDAYIVFPGVQTGLTDRLSIGAGMSIVPGLSLDEQIFYITPKLGVYQSANVNVAVGVLAAGAKELSDASPFGLGYGVVTLGNEDASVTAGAGFGFSREETSSVGLFMFGGTARVSKGLALVTENYVTTFDRETEAAFSGGVRFIGDRLSVNLAALGATGANTLLPYVAFIYRF